MPPTKTPSAPRNRRTSDKLTHRKRAPIACQFCRLRKTRCDGVKPVCGFCQHHDAQCVWGVAVSTDMDHLESTPTEKEILRRLDELKGLISDATATGHHLDGATPHSTNPPHEKHQGGSTTAASQSSALSPAVADVSPFRYTCCESLLAWPIFRSIADPRDVGVESFVADCRNVDSSDDGAVLVWPTSARPSANRASLDIRGDLVIMLCRKFLNCVHPRNPILDSDQLMRYARRVAEHGLDWDGPSCLVVRVVS